jgi:polysaccharide biosynthesis protein PelF
MKRTVDICLVLEGTYPYVRGGVSAWLHQLVQNLSEHTFALIFLGGRRKDYGEPQYQVPPNVVHVETHYLEDALRGRAPKRASLSHKHSTELRAFHAALAASGARKREAEAAIDRTLCTLACPGGVQLSQFLYGAGAWDLLCAAYADRAREVSFLDYFWTLRLLHAPLFQLAVIAREAPDARAYHTISTGYAGLLGAMLECRRQRPLILSEHGIYTKERRIDLNQSESFDPKAGEWGAGESRSELRDLWVCYFESLGRLTYRSANPIVALSEANRQRQIADGAPATRTRVISNGIDVAKFEQALWSRAAEVPQVIGLLGRVVPIKDVKTFIRAIGLLAPSLPSARAWVIGGADEDPAYAAECEALVGALELKDRIAFVGHKVPAEVFPKLGVLMLTSISEGQPLAILEAFAAGVPCIATDVGACRELIEGRDDTDRALGKAGRVVPFADAAALAEAAVELLTQPEIWRSCQAAGLERVRRHYDQRSMLDAYRDVYRIALEA